LGGHGGNRRLIAEDHGIPRLNVGRPVILNDTQNFASEKEAAMSGDCVPTLRVEVIDSVSEDETEAGRPMPFTVALA
jgi:hypothetical protein